MAPTIRALADRADRPDELVAAGELLDMRFRDGGKALSLRAGKILHLLLTAPMSRKETRDMSITYVLHPVHRRARRARLIGTRSM